MHGLGTINRINLEARARAAEIGQQPLLPFTSLDCLDWSLHFSDIPRLHEMPAGWEISAVSLGSQTVRRVEGFGEIPVWEVDLTGSATDLDRPVIGRDHFAKVMKDLFDDLLRDDQRYNYAVGVVYLSVHRAAVCLFKSIEPKFRRTPNVNLQPDVTAKATQPVTA